MPALSRSRAGCVWSPSPPRGSRPGQRRSRGQGRTEMGSIINRSKRRAKPALYVKFQENGRQRMVHSHQPTKELARKFLARIEANIAAGKVGMAEPTPEDLAKKRMTVRELGERFVAEYTSPRVKDVDRYRKMAEYLFGKHLYPAVGAVPAMALTAAQLERFRDERRAAGLGPQSVRHVLAFTSRMYNWGAARGIIDCSNPSEAVDKPQLGRDDDDFDYLSRDEVESLLNWAKEHQPSECPLYATAVYSGMRLGELYGLRWSDVTFDLGIIGVRRSYRTTPKSGKGRHIRINPRLAPILRAWKTRCPTTAEGLVFPAPLPDEHRKLTMEQVEQIRQRAARGERRSELAPHYGASWPAVAMIRLVERNSH